MPVSPAKPVQRVAGLQGAAAPHAARAQGPPTATVANPAIRSTLGLRSVSPAGSVVIPGVRNSVPAPAAIGGSQVRGAAPLVSPVQSSASNPVATASTARDGAGSAQVRPAGAAPWKPGPAGT